MVRGMSHQPALQSPGAELRRGAAVAGLLCEALSSLTAPNDMNGWISGLLIRMHIISVFLCCVFRDACFNILQNAGFYV